MSMGVATPRDLVASAPFFIYSETEISLLTAIQVYKENVKDLLFHIYFKKFLFKAFNYILHLKHLCTLLHSHSNVLFIAIFVSSSETNQGHCFKGSMTSIFPLIVIDISPLL